MSATEAGAPPPPPPKRSRVVLADVAPERRTPRHARVELQEQTRVGDALVRGLVRAQLTLSLRLAAVVVIGLGGLPLLFVVAPTVARQRPFGVGLPWLLLGFAAYLFLFGVGWVYVHLVERTERDFTDLVDRPEK